MKKVIFCFVLINMALAGNTQELFVSVRDFTARSGYSKEELEMITDLFTTDLKKTGGVQVATRRGGWGEVLEEVSSQQEGFIAQEEIMQLGTGAGAKAIITGELMKLGSSNILNLIILDAESGKILSSTRKTFESIDDLLNIFPSLANDIVKLLRK